MKWLKVIGVTLIIIIIHFFLKNSDGFIQNIFYSFRGKVGPAEDTVIVAIDPGSINVIGDWPWKRTKIAELVDSVSACGPSVIFVNCFFRPKDFAGMGDEDKEAIRAENKDLARAFIAAQNVVVPYFFEKFEKSLDVQLLVVPPERILLTRFLNMENTSAGSDLYIANAIRSPEQAVLESARSLGYHNIGKEQGIHTTRHILQTIVYANNFYPAISLEIAREHLKLDRGSMALKINEEVALGDHLRLPMNTDGSSMINFYGPSKAFPYISASDLLGRNFNKQRCAGKIVIIGITDPALKRDYDGHITPFDNNMAASEVWANIIENTLTASFINSSSLFFALVLPLIIILLLAIPCTLVCVKMTFKKQTLTLFACFAVLVFTGFIFFLFKIWVPLLVPLLYIAGLFLSFVWKRFKVRGLPLATMPGGTTGINPSETILFSQTGQLMRIGRYQIIKELGSGAMGTVYKANDPVINRTVAIKTIRRDLGIGANKELRERFLREAHAAGTLSHPNIVIIYDYGDTDSVSYIAMEYLEGTSLEEKLANEKKLGVAETIAIVCQVADGLDKAHAQGIVHRDIKPANIMLMNNDTKVKIMDFGVAKISNAAMTQTGKTLGTPYYMSPEQINGEEIDNRSDIFSLGVIAYECLAGVRPFRGENISKLSYAILQETQQNLSSIDSNVSPAVDEVLNKALAKERHNRFAHAAEFSTKLKKVLI